MTPDLYRDVIQFAFVLIQVLVLGLASVVWWQWRTKVSDDKLLRADDEVARSEVLKEMKSLRHLVTNEMRLMDVRLSVLETMVMGKPMQTPNRTAFQQD